MAEKKKELTESERDTLLAKIQKDLPDKWIVQFSKKHKSRVYFFNTADGSRTWEHPGFAEGQTKSQKCGVRKRKANVTNVPSSGKVAVEDCEKDIDVQGQKKRKSHERMDTRCILPLTKKSFHRSFTTTKNECLPEPNTVRKTKRRKKKNKLRTDTDHHKRNEQVEFNQRPESDEEKLECPVSEKLFENLPSTSANNITSLSCERSGLINLRDVEMEEVDLSPPRLPDSTTRNIDEDFSQTFRKEGQKLSEEQEIAVILDTNVLLRNDSLKFIEQVVEDMSGESLGQRGLSFIIPWVVLQELDHQKKNKDAARHAISFLNWQFQRNKSMVRGQTIFEAATVIDGLNIENNDDRVLQCCFFMKQSSNNNNDAVLVTQDKNLMNKALTNHIKCLDDVRDLEKKFIGNKKNTATTSKLRLNITQRTTTQTCDVNNNLPPKISYLKSVLSPCDCKTIYEKNRTCVLSSLRFILEKEMKEAFDDLWLDIVLRKPPWTLMDVLQCMKKHWLAVFKVMGVDHILQVHVEKLINLESSHSQASTEDIDFVCDWSGSSLSLISGINQKGKYDEPVKSDLVVLQNLHKSLKRKAVFDTNDDKQLKESNNIEMKVVETNSIDFWSALDMIWTAIISHCGMIFRSLGFLSSRIDEAPEICQALSANFETIPEKTVAARALPLITDLVQSLQASLQQITSLSKADAECDIIFADLIHTLWTTIQAFSIDCNIRTLINSCKELSLDIMSSDEMMGRLKTGFQQLEVVKQLLHECIAAISSNPVAFLV